MAVSKKAKIGVGIGAGLLTFLLLSIRSRKAYAAIGTSGRLYPGGMFGHNRGDHLHAGLDIYAPVGTPIYALASGIVDYSGIIYGYGNVVVIAHDDDSGQRSLYGHMTERSVNKGDKVKKGTKLGTVGRTAYGRCGEFFCTATEQAHLHLEIITSPGNISPRLARLDPLPWMMIRNEVPFVGYA